MLIASIKGGNKLSCLIFKVDKDDLSRPKINLLAELAPKLNVVIEPTKTVAKLEKIVEVPTNGRKEIALGDLKEDDIVVLSVREEEDLIENSRFSKVKEANPRF